MKSTSNVCPHHLSGQRIDPSLHLSRSPLQGIFISRVTEQGPAAQAGIVVGDKVLSVNGNTLVRADHHRAVEVLKRTGNVITMVVAREVILSRKGSSSVRVCVYVYVH